VDLLEVFPNFRDCKIDFSALLVDMFEDCLKFRIVLPELQRFAVLFIINKGLYVLLVNLAKDSTDMQGVD